MRKTEAGVWLLVLVAAVHQAYEPLAALLYPGAEVKAAKAIFYVARGVEGAVLWALVYAWAPARTPALVAACAWGFVESAQAAVCRLALPIGGAAPVVPAWGGVCDLASGWPVAGLTAVVVLLILSVVQEAQSARTKGR